MAHWPRCRAEGCGTGTPLEGGLCSWHSVNGEYAINDRNWKPRTRRFYLVYWVDAAIAKIGVEATLDSRRITKWEDHGAETLSVWEIPSESVEEFGKALYGVEQALISSIPFDGADVDEYQQLVPDLDGVTETFTVNVDELPDLIDLIEAEIASWGIPAFD